MADTMAKVLTQIPTVNMVDVPSYLGANELPRTLESDFNRDMQFAPGWSDWRKGFIDRYGEPPNTSPGGDYNYRMAWADGQTPSIDPGSGEYHGGSIANLGPMNPVELKAGYHPTKWKQDYMEKFGTNPDIDAENGDYSGGRSDFMTKMARADMQKALMPK
jgi:hypothetical protein